jgi:hypothetical protein
MLFHATVVPRHIFWEQPCSRHEPLPDKGTSERNSEQTAWYAVRCTKISEVIMKEGWDALVFVKNSLYWESMSDMLFHIRVADNTNVIRALFEARVGCTTGVQLHNQTPLHYHQLVFHIKIIDISDPAYYHALCNNSLNRKMEIRRTQLYWNILYLLYSFIQTTCFNPLKGSLSGHRSTVDP